MKMYGGVDVYTHVFLTSGERAPSTDWIRGWANPLSRSGRHGEVKILPPTGTRTPTPFVVQPVASRCTDS
jgi:hypothetical protein